MKTCTATRVNSGKACGKAATIVDIAGGAMYCEAHAKQASRPYTPPPEMYTIVRQRTGETLRITAGVLPLDADAFASSPAFPSEAGEDLLTSCADTFYTEALTCPITALGLAFRSAQLFGEDTAVVMIHPEVRVVGRFDAARIRSPQPEDVVCRHCKCTNERACAGGCFWVAVGLCSNCLAKGLK